MGSFSIWHWLIVGVIVILLFGRGRISDVMGDLAKGITSFKRGLKEDEADPNRPAAETPRIAAPPAAAPAPAEPVVEPAREDRNAS